MAKESILMIEDDEDILEALRYNFAKEGYQAQGVISAEEGLKIARDRQPDLILLDLMLPGMDGLETCRVLKSHPKTSEIPVVMLTAKGEEADVVAGLEIGADDYITKPFSPRVVLARVRAVLRRQSRTEGDEAAPIHIHNLVIHPGRHQVLIDGEPVELTFTEFRILHFLACHPGWVFTRHQITNAVRGDDYPVTDRSVDVHIVGLRKKLGDSGACIETVRGVGYRFRE